MAELSAESRMNIAALKRSDPYMKELLETAAHVALYTFNANVNEWEKTEVEGALFVYSRTGEPFHNILIMNRLNSNNFVEPVISGLDLHLEDPYLLYRTGKGSIYCIWFYDKGECSRIGQALGKLVRETLDNKTARKKPDGVDIFSMLSKAQERYNSVAMKTDDGNKPQPESDNTPKSVKDFFMKASWGTQLKAAPKPGGLMGVVGTQRPMPPPGLDPVPGRVMNMPQKPLPIFEKLMMDPQNSVQHIEKQQKCLTPQSELAALIRGNMEPKKIEEKVVVAAPPPLQAPPQNGLSFLETRDPVSPTTNTVQTLNFFNSNLTKSLEQQRLGTDDTNPKPTLMPPMMFTSSKSLPPKTTPAPPPPKVEPLTKNQLLQAIDYLLTNDPDFINQLHEAYVKSIKERATS